MKSAEQRGAPTTHSSESVDNSGIGEQLPVRRIEFEFGDVHGIEPAHPVHLVVTGAGLTADDHGVENRRHV